MSCDQQLSRLAHLLCVRANNRHSNTRLMLSCRANAISIETVDHAINMFAELFRQQLLPYDGGFVIPETDKKRL